MMMIGGTDDHGINGGVIHHLAPVTGCLGSGEAFLGGTQGRRVGVTQRVDGLALDPIGI